MFVLDTDTYSHLLHEHAKVAERLEQAVIQRQAVGITIITKIEVLQGRMSALLKADTHERFLGSQEKLFHAEERLRKVAIYSLDSPTLDVFDELNATRSLRKIGRADLLIASIVRVRKATLVTRNLKHFKLVPQLKLANWVD
jgi:tRNA(fMet)-specific endonuclease VapC